MPKTRHILDALRVAACWLLMVSVFFGPAGLGGSTFASASETCGASCPCDEAAHDPHANERAKADPCGNDAAANLDHDDSEPCKNDCPDDCPSCGCCVGIAMAVLPLAATSGAVRCTSARMLSPVDATASGACAGVFRPPRFLT